MWSARIQSLLLLQIDNWCGRCSTAGPLSLLPKVLDKLQTTQIKRACYIVRLILSQIFDTVHVRFDYKICQGFMHQGHIIVQAFKHVEGHCS